MGFNRAIIAAAVLLGSLVQGCNKPREYDACVEHQSCTSPNTTRQQAEALCDDLDVYGKYSRTCTDCILSSACENYHCADGGIIGNPDYVSCQGEMPACGKCGPF